MNDPQSPQHAVQLFSATRRKLTEQMTAWLDRQAADGFDVVSVTHVAAEVTSADGFDTNPGHEVLVICRKGTS